MPITLAEHAQPAAVGHADHRRIEAGVGSHRQDLIEDRDRRLGAFQPEALRADVLGGQELLERLGGVQPLDDALLALLGDDAAARPRPCDWIQRCSAKSWMCMYSMPIVRQ